MFLVLNVLLVSSVQIDFENPTWQPLHFTRWFIWCFLFTCFMFVFLFLHFYLLSVESKRFWYTFSLCWFWNFIISIPFFFFSNLYTKEGFPWIESPTLSPSDILAVRCSECGLPRVAGKGHRSLQSFARSRKVQPSTCAPSCSVPPPGPPISLLLTTILTFLTYILNKPEIYQFCHFCLQ